MFSPELFKKNSVIYFVGIKGTGVCALAELMHNTGIKVSGSDIPEVFYTDAILKELNIAVHEDFDPSRIRIDTDMVIYSAAYSAETNPQLVRARELGIPILKYTDALGVWSARFDSTGICGVHGKTTTTAICGVLMRAAGIPAQILAGSAAVDFVRQNDKGCVHARSTLILGDKYFIAETCEYRRHFLSFHPRRILLTSVESDHQDFFPDYKSIRDAFVEYCRLLPQGGQLIYCADNPGASEVVNIIENDNKNIEFIPYGFTACGDYKIISYNVENKSAVFSVAVFPGDIKMRLPGRHIALNTAAALALAISLAKNEKGDCGKLPLDEQQIQSIKDALENFKSTKRRSEIIGEAGGIIFMDDYGHHPTAVKTTLNGIRSFYPAHKLIVSFMSHTYTRTSAMLEEFAACFNDADVLFLHRIYASARENYAGGVDGRTLYEKAAAIRSKDSGKETFYVEEPQDAFAQLREVLKDACNHSGSGVVFITLGAGNNWLLCEKLFSCFNYGEEAAHG